MGLLLGSLAGYAYYYFIGCSSGTCSITSKPINSSVYGSIMGALLFSSIKDFTQKKNSPPNEQNN
tara:strand:+ start:525 stop:719 length:195 start_codon:yes stop_codon:yes gene_type:complete